MSRGRCACACRAGRGGGRLAVRTAVPLPCSAVEGPGVQEAWAASLAPPSACNPDAQGQVSQQWLPFRTLMNRRLDNVTGLHNNLTNE